jgi:hypothetical protein
MTIVSMEPRRQGADHRADGDPWWLTVRSSCRVLVMVSSVTTAKRLWDIAGLLHGDLRVQLEFTVVPSIFNDGAVQTLAARGVPLLPWDKAVARPFDLAITANIGHMDEVDAPVALFSHGASRNSLARPRGRGSLPAPGPVIGFSRADLIRAGMLVPSAIALGHENELELLEQGCPEALPVAHVVGDPCYDRIVSGAGLRAAYRSALGLEPGQKLVAVTSTWRTNSLLGSSAHVVERLSRELPEHYRVVVLTHPNIWAAHGSYQMRAWFGSWGSRGVALTSPETDWQPILMASDFVVGDHGSVTLYGSALGVPVLLGSFPEDDVHPSGGAAALGRVAPRIVPGIPLSTQLEHAAAEFDPAAMARVAALISSEPGGFARHTRRLLYRLLGLGQPATPTALPPATPPASLDALGRAA